MRPLVAAVLTMALGAAPAAQGDSVRALMEQARRQSAAGQPQAALDTLRQARLRAPNAEDVLAAYAQVALALGRPVPAAGALDPLTRMCPTEARYHYLLGIAYAQAGAVTAAVEALRAAEGRDPDDLRTLVALGLALNNRKQHDEARRYLLRSLDLDPGHPDALAALAEADEALGSDTAEAHAARALAIDPAHPTASYVTGLIRLAQGRYAEARDAFLRAGRADPSMARAHYQASLAYARLGDEARARAQVELYQRALREQEATLERLRQETGLTVTPAREP